MQATTDTILYDQSPTERCFALNSPVPFGWVACPYGISREEIITNTLVSKIATVMNPTELYLVTVVVTHPVAMFRPTDPKGKVNALNVEPE